MNLINIEILIVDFRICPIQSDKAFFAKREKKMSILFDVVVVGTNITMSDSVFECFGFGVFD